MHCFKGILGLLFYLIFLTSPRHQVRERLIDLPEVTRRSRAEWGLPTDCPAPTSGRTGALPPCHAVWGLAKTLSGSLQYGRLARHPSVPKLLHSKGPQRAPHFWRVTGLSLGCLGTFLRGAAGASWVGPGGSGCEPKSVSPPLPCRLPASHLLRSWEPMLLPSGKGKDPWGKGPGSPRPCFCSGWRKVCGQGRGPRSWQGSREQGGAGWQVFQWGEWRARSRNEICARDTEEEGSRGRLCLVSR